MASPPNTQSPSTQHLQRSISAPAQAVRSTQFQMGPIAQDSQQQDAIRVHSHGVTVGRVGLSRSLSRTDAVKE